MKAFDHEKLLVYHKSLQFMTWLHSRLEAFPKGMAVRDQLDRASTSIPLNIAEGNGKFTGPDRCRFFDNARGSALECAAGLDVLVAKGKVDSNDIRAGKELLQEVVAMLVGLIRANSDYRMHESLEGAGRTVEAHP